MTAISFHDAMSDPHLFGDIFAGDSWANWKMLAKAIFGEPLDADELAVFTSITGRQHAPDKTCSETFLIVGRRGGKDRFASAVVTYLATVGAEAYGWRKRLSRGERAVVQLLAVDRDQAAVAFRYIAALFDEKPIFRKLRRRQTTDTIELNNGFAIEVATNDARRIRGRTLVAVVMDEVAHWRNDEATNPDELVYQALKPAMATMPGALLLAISSPYARRGLLHRKYQQFYGHPGTTLVVKAPTWVMNPLLPRDGEVIGEAYEADPVAAAAEFGGEFRSDLQAYVDRESVEACIEPGVRERPFERRWQYYGFVDPSGGSVDSMCLSIGHREGKTSVVDVVREVRPPFSPESTVESFCATLKAYKVVRVTGDRYGGQWPSSVFESRGVTYVPAAKSRSDIYTDVLPLLNSGLVALLDDRRLTTQICSLERKVSPRGRDIVDHPPSSHDDLANVALGVVDLCWTRGSGVEKREWYGPRPRPKFSDPLQDFR